MDSANEGKPEESCKLNPSSCFITITLDDRNQKVSSDYTPGSELNFRRRQMNRLLHATKLVNNVVVPALDDFMSEYQLVTEISEALQSKGKYYPRIHFHVIGVLTDVISCLMHMGDLYHIGLGYHIISDLDTQQYNKKVDYMNKQVAHWTKFLRRRNYTTIKLFHKKERSKRKG